MAGFIILGRYCSVFPLGINFWNSHNTPFGTDKKASPFSNPEIRDDTVYSTITESRNIIFDCILLLNISLLVNFIKLPFQILLIYFLIIFSDKLNPFLPYLNKFPPLFPLSSFLQHYQTLYAPHLVR